MNDLPGPSGLRALRDLGVRRDLLTFVERSTARYGETFGVRLGPWRACLSSDPEVLERVFVTHANAIRKWDVGPFARVFGQGLLTSAGDLWRRQRRLIQPVLRQDRMPEHAPTVVALSEAMLAGWGDTETREVHDDMLRLSLDVAAASLFGVDASAVAPLIHEANHLMSTYFNEAMSSVPIPLSIPTPRNRRMLRAIDAVDAAVLGLIAKRRAEPSGHVASARQDFLGAMLAARDEAGSGMDDQQLRDECMTMLLASHETTAVALTWTLMLVAQHPEVGVRLQAELDAHLGGRAPGFEDLKPLTLVQQTLHEAMRLYPPVWGIGRVNLEPIDIGPTVLAPGTQIFLLPYLTHRSARWFPDPMRFHPDRWADPAIHALPKTAYLPFGAGPRKCVGVHFAMLEAMLMLACILRRFTLAGGGRAVDFQASVTLRPATGVHLHVARRSA